MHYRLFGSDGQNGYISSTFSLRIPVNIRISTPKEPVLYIPGPNFVITVSADVLESVGDRLVCTVLMTKLLLLSTKFISY